MMRSYHEQLQIHALNDLTNRAKSGILPYLSVWLFLVFVYRIDINHPEFFYLNSGIVVGIFIARIAHFLVLNRNPILKIAFMNQWLVITILFAAAHWGAMTAWIVHDKDMSELHTIMMIITPVFGIGGACTLSISSEIRILYPTFMFAPLIAVMLHVGDSESLLLAGLIVFCLIYIFASSRASHNDYWEAITNHMVAEERAELMEKLSTIDPLTQLKNRMYFDKELAHEWKRNSRLKCPLSIIMLDLDYFKSINDNYGHMFGDQCLRDVATAIAKEVRRPTDCVARYGGEEFIALLPNTNEKAAQMIAERMRAVVSQLKFEVDGNPVQITCSIGGATLVPLYRDDPSVLIMQADSALYHAKNTGRDSYVANSDLT